MYSLFSVSMRLEIGETLKLYMWVKKKKTQVLEKVTQRCKEKGVQKEVFSKANTKDNRKHTTTQKFVHECS